MTAVTTFRYFRKRNESICTCKDLYKNVYISLIGNNQNLGTIRKSINRQMHKPIEVYSDNVIILLSNKKE